MRLQNDDNRRFVVATPARSVCDDNARALEKAGKLRLLALGTRRGSQGVPSKKTRLNPLIGFTAYAATRLFSTDQAESIRFRLHPWFDHWVKRQLKPGDHIISSYGYTNACFEWVQKHGGKTFLDGGNSHPENFWSILEEEHRRWNCPQPPIPRHHYARACAMMEHVDYVLSPSAFVTHSFLARGFRPEQILRNVYPLDLSCFSPAKEPRPSNRPLTLISTGSLSLRKGTPYLLEAFRLVRNQIPNARLLLTNAMQDSVRPILSKYSDLPIEWSPPLPHLQLAKRLQSADVFLLPSLEDGFARTVTEALACGLPVITTPNTGASDLIQPDVNGEVVPIRDSHATAEAITKWASKISVSDWRPKRLIDPVVLSANRFEKEFNQELHKIGI